MWIRKRIDISGRDLAYGLAQCFSRGNRADLVCSIEKQWPQPERVFVCLSVRSGLDLLFEALALPANSEVLMTALTIPDMPRIIAKHGCIPVPLDLDVHSMDPLEDCLHRAMTPATRAIVVAHLFGGRIHMEPVLDLARKHGLLVIEDCAQAFSGCAFSGHAESDVSMFSFGSIKTATALGGAVLMVRDRTLKGRMAALQSGYPVQSRSAYIRRLLKYSLLTALTCWPAFSVLYRLLRLLRLDYDLILHRSSRGFAGDDFFGLIRQQPCTPLLALMGRRLRTYSPGRIASRRIKGTRLASLLCGRLQCPGAEALDHSYWVFPVLVHDKLKCIRALRNAGFDATDKQSMQAVSSPGGRQDPVKTRAMLEKMIYLPLYPAIPENEIERMAEVLREADA
jgi:dTDP-4-amino-4,6-dideoxygalactose transaminase